MEIKVGQEIVLEITALGLSGEGIGSYEGLKIFVEGALPEETVQVVLTELKKNYGKASLTQILKKSSSRVVPVCPLFDECGGCQIMHLSYKEQLEIKKKRVADAFLRIGKDPIASFFPIHPSEPSLHYRNKIQLPATLQEGKVALGLYAKGSHEIVPIEKCFIHSNLGESVYQRCLQIVKDSSIAPYDETTQKGELRHLLIKTAVFNEQVLIVLITTQKPSKDLREVAKKMSEIPFVKGVVHHKNARYDNVILDQHFTCLAGEDHIYEILCGLTFKLSGASFFQVNPFQAERLYKKALELACLDSSMKVLDAYCGIGTLSLLAARQASFVIGIECVPQAIEDAKYNAALNQISNATFFCSTVEKKIHQLKEIDVAIINPPRKGCDPRVLEALKRISPQRIIYISCDPATLARDSQILKQLGFNKDHIEAFDLFPQTMHVETVARFSRV